jgi:hypothetical protein
MDEDNSFLTFHIYYLPADIRIDNQEPVTIAFVTQE